MPPLSVVIITYNEERNIGRCLESVRDIADDILVVDSYSTDRTVEICKQYSVRVVFHPFEGYIEQKNWALSQALYPHVLSLDADEALSDRLRESIRKVKEQWTHDGYYFNRLTCYCGKWIKHGSWYPSRKLRLWDSSKGAWHGLNPHDRFRMIPEARKKKLEGDLLHYSYFSIQEHVEQSQSFAEIVARAYYRAGRKARLFHIIFSPSWRFFRDFFIKLGFLDGYYGYLIALYSARETNMKYRQLRRIHLVEGSQPVNRICFINSTKSGGGGEKWHLDVAISMHNRGKEVLVITNRRSALFNRIMHTRLNVINVSISNLSFLNPLKIFQIAAILKRERVKTAILNLSTDLKIAGLSAKLAGVKNIIYRRGIAVPVRNTLLNRILFRRIITGMIANSEETRRTILLNNKTLLDSRKIRVIYNGIDLKHFDRMDRTPVYQKKSGEVVIGNAGRLSVEKGQLYLINLAKELKKMGIPFTILIAGTGNLEKNLINYAVTQGVSEEVRFLGFVENIRSVTSSIDLFVLTSLWEGFGFVLVEAMADSKPVIAFDIGSSDEIIENGKTGYIVEKANIGAMAEKIRMLAENPDLCKEMGRNGRRRVEEKFEISRCIEQVEEMIDSF